MELFGIFNDEIPVLNAQLQAKFIFERSDVEDIAGPFGLLQKFQILFLFLKDLEHVFLGLFNLLDLLFDLDFAIPKLCEGLEFLTNAIQKYQDIH